MRSHLVIPFLLAALALVFGGANALAAAGTAEAHVAAAETSTARYTPDSQDCAFLSIINGYRKQNGLGALALSKELGAAAVHHSLDMATNNYFSHTLFNGTTWQQNIANYGYPSTTTRGENIAAGNADANNTFSQWKNSPDHNANMLNTKYKAIGIAREYNANATYGWYWTTTFGSYVDSTVTCPSTSSVPTTTSYGFVGGGHTSNSTSSQLAYDGDASTSWATTASTAPRYAYVYFDLGGVNSIGAIQWMFAKTGAADSFKIQVSSDKSTWTTIATKGNASSAKTWQTLAWSGTARYVRFSFSNPNNDIVLGYLAEVTVTP